MMLSTLLPQGFPDISVGKECRRPGFNSWVRKTCWRRGRLPTPVFLGFPCGSAGKESACNVRDLASIPELGRSPGEGQGYPLQYSGLYSPWYCRVRRDWTTFTLLCDPMDCSMPDFHVLHYLLEFAHNSCPLSQWYHLTISSSATLFLLCLQSFPASRSFPVYPEHSLKGLMLKLKLQHFGHLMWRANSLEKIICK